MAGVRVHIVQGATIRPAPERSDDLEAVDHWLRSTEPGFALDEVLSWMLVSGTALGALPAPR